MRYDLTNASATLRKLNPGLFNDPGPGPHLQQEKQQDADAGQTHHQTRVPAADKKDHNEYRVTVLFRYSDRRRRDLDGATATILDALITARRLLDPDPDFGCRRGKM
jgi:hypothetical protein